jgi:hypothetical protein
MAAVRVSPNNHAMPKQGTLAFPVLKCSLCLQAHVNYWTIVIWPLVCTCLSYAAVWNAYINRREAILGMTQIFFSLMIPHKQPRAILRMAQDQGCSQSLHAEACLDAIWVYYVLGYTDGNVFSCHCCWIFHLIQSAHTMSWGIGLDGVQSHVTGVE